MTSYLIEALYQILYTRFLGRAPSFRKLHGNLSDVIHGWHLVEQLILSLCEEDRHLFRKVEQLLELLKFLGVDGVLLNVCSKGNLPSMQGWTTGS